MSLLYSGYGLKLLANRPIPGLVELPATPQVDVHVWLGLMPASLHEVPPASQPVWYVSPYRDERGEPALTIRELAGGAYHRLLYRDGTEFLVDRSGTQVWATWPAVSTLEETASYLLGPVLGFVLRLRGVTCLHASAIAAEERALAILGQVGAGKSTTAAALAGRGHPVLSDDVVALAEEGEACLVQPGYPRLRLRPSSLDALAGVAGQWPHLPPTWGEKRYHLDLIRNGYRFQHQPLPLAAIYLLGERCTDSAAPYVETVPAGNSLMSLVANTYANRLLDRALRAREFELLGRLIARVRLRRVRPHADPAYLSRLCDVILDDFRASPSSAPAVADAERGY